MQRMVCSLSHGLPIPRIFPAAEAYRTQKGFLKQVVSFTSQNEGGLCLYKTREAVFYLGNKSPIPEYHGEEQLMASYKKGGPRWVLMKNATRFPQYLMAMLCSRKLISLGRCSGESKTCAGRPCREKARIKSGCNYNSRLIRRYIV